MTVRVDEESRIIACPVVLAVAGTTVVRRPLGQGGFIKGTNLFLGLSLEGQMRRNDVLFQNPKISIFSVEKPAA